MPQMLRLSQGHWLNLEQLVEVVDHGGDGAPLTVSLAAVAVTSEGLDTYMLFLHGEERERLLTWLETHSAYVSMPRADNDDENPPF
jgi:hypothetical protein